MIAQHTPGPWHIEPLVATHGADMAICAPSNGWVVAVIQNDPDIQTSDNPNGDTVVWHDADKANAALIAEAPAMLAALRRVVQWADTGCDPSRKSIDQVRAIIARIDGRA